MRRHVETPNKIKCRRVPEWRSGGKAGVSNRRQPGKPTISCSCETGHRFSPTRSNTTGHSVRVFHKSRLLETDGTSTSYYIGQFGHRLSSNEAIAPARALKRTPAMSRTSYSPSPISISAHSRLCIRTPLPYSKYQVSFPCVRPSQHT